MDFVDLDRVLDEFEEEEKQALSITPGQELKPSGFIQFLEKHQEQDWERINSGPIPATNGSSPDGHQQQNSNSVSYDEPFDITNAKLSLVSNDHSLDSLSSLKNEWSPNGRKAYQSEIVTSLTRVSPNGSQIGTVYTSLNGYERKGIANTSERKGTIACQASEVQTDALSPASEEELMSSPFPKTDILVDGHGDTTVSNPCDSNGEQNHSPIYATMDPSNIVSTTNDFSSLSEQGFVTENQTLSTYQAKDVLQEMSEYPSIASSSGLSEQVPAAANVVGFGDSLEDDIDEDEVNMYLEGMNDSEVTQPDPVSLVGSVSSSSQATRPSGSTRNLAEEISAADSQNYAGDLNSESLPKKFCPDKSIGKPNGHNPDVVAGLSTQQPQQPSNTQTGMLQKSDSDIAQSRNVVFNSLSEDKMEIQQILDYKLTQKTSQAGSIGEQLLQGNMEIEGVLDEAIQHQQSIRQNTAQQNCSEAQVQPGSDQMDTKPVTPKECVYNGTQVASMSRDQSNLSVSPSSYRRGGSPMLGVGARPKDPSAIKRNRPNTLLGLSKVNLDFPAVVKEVESDNSSCDMTSPQPPHSQEKHLLSKEIPQAQHPSQRHTETSSVFVEPQVTDETKQRMNPEQHQHSNPAPIIHDYSGPSQSAESNESPPESYCGSPSDQSQMSRIKRPTSLNLPHRPGFDVGSPQDRPDMSPSHTQASDACNDQTAPPNAEVAQDNEVSEGAGAVGQSSTVMDFSGELPPEGFPDDLALYGGEQLGEEAPFWIPDADAPACMLCQAKFTMWKRRHHCRCCGKVLCSTCCSARFPLPYLNNKEERVCKECHYNLCMQRRAGGGSATGGNSPNPNNPTEYCSKVPPTQQASGNTIPPVVMVPTGVLKTAGSQRKSNSEPKQVMFSDGIRPGGDLTELDGPEQTQRRRRSGRGGGQRRSNNTGSTSQPEPSEPPTPKTKEESLLRSPCLVPEAGLPPLYIITGDTGVIETDDVLNQIDYTSDYKSTDGPLISYAVNKNLSVGVRIINMDCCVQRWCWCFVTRGLCTAGQAEIVILLELTSEELVMDSGLVPPTDIFLHFHELYTEALKGNFVTDMGHTILSQSFLGNRDHGGFLYVQPSFQCLSKLPLPETPYLFGLLLQKWEVPWAKVFPIRLLLRLGAEYRYYPCPLVSVRNRKPVFYEIGHTIINLLADFRNYQYMLNQVRGVTIHMENKKTVISFPRNRYDDVMKVVRNSNEHVMALGSAFSCEADSHLVCIQNEDGTYQTQAINIQNKPRLVTGASFVVFNGALKASSGLRAKSSIVEDGLMIQVLPETLAQLKQAMVDTTTMTIQCGPVDQEQPDESVEVRWVTNDTNFNLGVKSPLDGTSLEGVESVSVKCPIDYLGTGDNEASQGLAIRWTCVYFLRSGHEEDGEGTRRHHSDPVDMSRLTEAVAQAGCMALAKHLVVLKQEGRVKLGLRVSLTRDAVGYEIGSKGEPLPPVMVADLDTYLVPIVHQASEEGLIMELIFNIVD